MSSPQSIPETHKALRKLDPSGHPTIEQIPTPKLFPGTAILRVERANIIAYSRAIFDGSRAYSYPVPLTLGSGAIGRIVAVGPDATRLKIGDLCLLDPTLHGRDDVGNQDGATFLSAFHHGYSGASRKLMDEWRDGTYAKFVRWPLENCHPVNEQLLFGSVAEGGRGYKIEDLLFIPSMLVPYGGLGPNGIDLKPGETVIVSPATGSWGSAAVHLCLELGAARVICLGRNATALEEVKQATGKPNRVTCVALTDDWEADSKSIQAVGGRIDVFFDISPQFAKESSHFKAAIMALSRRGRVCLMSGAGGDDVSLPLSKIMTADLTIKGKWMFEPVDLRRFVRLVETGTVRLHEDRQGGVQPFGSKCTKTFKLEEWKEAFDEAEKLGSSGYVLFEP